MTIIRKELEYSWNGVDTNFVYRGPAGLRVSGGTSTGRSQRNTCGTDGDNPNVEGREGNLYGGGCRIDNPFQTNVRANASYTIPWVDVLVGTVYQWRPGSARSATMDFLNTDITWEPSSAHRATIPCDTNGGAPGGANVGCLFTPGGFFGNNPTANVNNIALLDWGDLYGEAISLVDLNFQKNIRFLGKRFNFGVEVYNLFNSDAITAYEGDYDVYRQLDGSWGQDDPTTPELEVNEWGDVNGIVAPRFMRFSMEFHF